MFTALTEILAFAVSKRLDHHASVFQLALDVLRESCACPAGILSDAPLPSYAHRLAAAAETAWVFGGMLSWNDQAFDGADQDRFVSLTAQLYSCAAAALVSAANSARPKRWWRPWS
jgi:hypothetical protein